MITNKENLHAMQEETRQSINNAKKKITLEEKYKTCLGLKQYDRAKKYLLQIKEKEIAIARIKQMPDNIKVSIG